MAGTNGSQQFITSNNNNNNNGGNRNSSNAPLIEEDCNQIIVPETTSWKNLFAYMGPGFLVSIAYIDPGNFETDLQAGAQYKYELLWIILVASCAALVIQSLAANLGVVTGKHLAEHCRAEYPRIPNFILWILAEISIVACDIPEVIGTAFALNMLFSIPVWCGVLLTGLSTLVLLALQQYGVRKLEFLIAFLVFTIAACFFVELGYAKPDASEVLKGLFVPTLKGNGATGLAISLLGAMVMPHNLFLHSALVLSRKVPRSIQGIKDAGKLIIIASMILSFELPFALIPLLKFTSCKNKMGSHANSVIISVITWIIGSLIMAINVYFIVTSFFEFLFHGKLKVVARVFLGILGISGMLIYVAGILYLVVRKNEQKTTHLLSFEEPENGLRGSNPDNVGPLYNLSREDIVNMQLPQRVVDNQD